MSSAKNSSVDKRVMANSLASFLQIGAVLVLLLWCFMIISPFLNIIIWGVIISIAAYPGHLALTARLQGREKLSAAILVLIGLAIIIIPVWMLADSTINGLQYLATDFEDGAVSIPPPGENVAQWPLVGARIYEFWNSAAMNLEATLNEFTPQIRTLGGTALSFLGTAVMGILQFVFSVIIAGPLLTAAPRGYQTMRNIAASLAGTERGHALVTLTIATIRSVVKGVLGVAFIQMILAAIGLLVIGVPGAGLWAGAVLVLAIIQLPPILILGPIAVWVFSIADPVSASIFLVYSIIVSRDSGI